jgi:crotonobetainyl-CoA:carnitine CoA-transferase CaiB-like acyl-CoA transferase
LQGIRVADFSRVLAGPLCTQMLADAGAEVVKIEDPSRGDETRRWGPPFLKGVSTYFLAINRNKRSIALDLTRGEEITRSLIEWSDVVVDNFLPSQRIRHGLDRVSEHNPRAIHCMISGYDRDTADGELPGYDLLAQAGTGMMAVTGEAQGQPMKAGVAISDILTAHYAFGAISTALFNRERTGKGSSIEISLFAATLTSLINVAQNALINGVEPQRHGNEHPSIVPYQLFHASDRPFAIGAGTDRHFRALCVEVMRRPELAADPRFSTNAARVEHRALLIPILERRFGENRASTWVTRCRRAAVPASLVQGVAEALHSDGAVPLVGRIDHPLAGRYRSLKNPLRVDGKRAPVGTPPPQLGEHTDAVLRELGFAQSRIVELRREQIIGPRKTSAKARGSR